MTNTLEVPSTSFNTIYNSSLKKVQERPINKGWHLEGFYNDDWFTTEQKPDSLWHFLKQGGDSFDWVSDKYSYERVNPQDPGKTHWVPYDYKTLLYFWGTLLSLFWDDERECVVQVDSKALRHGILRTRELSVKDTSAYIWNEFRRIYLLLSPEKETLIHKRFFPKWHNVQFTMIIRPSREECRTFLLPFSQYKDTFTLRLEDKREINGIVYSVLVQRSFQLTNFTPPEMPDLQEMIIDDVTSMVGRTITLEEFHTLCDRHDWWTDTKMGRARKLNNLLKDQGVQMIKKKQRVNGISTWTYQIRDIEVVQVSA